MTESRSSRKFKAARGALAAVSAVALIPLSVVVSPVAHAADNTDPTAMELARSIMSTSSLSYLTGAELNAPYATSGGARSAMEAETPSMGFVRDGSSYAVLSTGNAADAFKSNDEDDLTTDFGRRSRVRDDDDYDYTTLALSLMIPEGINCLTGVDFRFFSEEYDEYVGQEFNDAFIMELDRTTWRAKDADITAPGNFAFDSFGNEISVNASGATTMDYTQPADVITYDGATPLLTAAVPISPGARTLYFSIFDQGDETRDSAVFIDNLRFGWVANPVTDCVKGAVPASILPPAPTGADPLGVVHDKYTIPEADGVIYQVDGVTVPAGTYPGTSPVTITAVASGVDPLRGTTSWTFSFTDSGAADVSSAGIGTAVQRADLSTAPLAKTHLLENGSPVSSLETPEGTFSVDPDTGKATFAPVLGWSGTTSVEYQVRESNQLLSTARYTVTVTKPTGPEHADLTSSGVGTQTQTQSVTVPPGGAVTLVVDGVASTSHTVPGQGTYTLDSESGAITFAPVVGFSGPATPAKFRVTDIYGQSLAADFTPTVSKPSPRALTDASSSGLGTEPQRQTFAPHAGEVMHLLNAAGEESLEVSVPSQGTYLLDPATGVVSFLPAPGFRGTAGAVTVQSTDVYGQRTTAKYTPSVTIPAAPVAESATSKGAAEVRQQVNLTVPAGGSVALLDRSGYLTTEIAVPGEGTYSVDTATGAIIFTPERGFRGQATEVTYAITDSYGQESVATYRASVEGSVKVTAALPGRGVVTNGKIITDCIITGARADRCDVVITSAIDGVTWQIGSKSVSVTPGTRRIRVAVPLNEVGRAVMQSSPGGIRIRARITVRATTGRSYNASRGAKAVAGKVTLRTIAFRYAKHKVSSPDTRYLVRARAALGKPRSVTCIGHTDSVSSSALNEGLGKKRAAAACAILTKGYRGKVVLRSKGEAAPRASNANTGGRAKNRRTEIIVRY